MADFPVKRGHTLLVEALAKRGWTKYRLAQALSTRDSVVAKVFNGERGVGIELAARIAKALPEDVPVASWTIDASPAEERRFKKGLEALLARGRGRFRSSDTTPPEAP